MTEQDGGDHPKPFHCRQWVFAKIVHILDQRSADKIQTSNISGILVVGEPGAGKTALTSELVRSPANRDLSGRILASHFIDFFRPESHCVSAFVLHLIDQLKSSKLIENYSEKLRRDDMAEWIQPERIRTHPDESFQRCVLFPLLEIDTPPRNLLLVVDSLDEPGQPEESAGIAELLANHHHLLPPWLLLLVTMRRSNKQLIRSFTGFKKIQLDQVKRGSVVRDVQHYILARLEADAALRRHLTRETAPILNMLHIKSHGCFLYVESVLDGVADGSVLLRDIPEIPGTLNGLYLWLCQRLFTRRNWNKIHPILSIVMAARAAPSRDDILAALDTLDPGRITRSEFRKRMHLIRKLVVPCGEGRMRIFHSSFGEWLTDVKHCTQRFLVKMADGHARWAVTLAAASASGSAQQPEEMAFHLGRMEIQPPLEAWHLPLWLLWTGAALPDRSLLQQVMVASLMENPESIEIESPQLEFPSSPKKAEIGEVEAMSSVVPTTLVERRNSVKGGGGGQNSVNESDDPEQSLFYAAQMGYSSAVAKLCGRYKSSISPAALRHALSIAARQGHANLVSILLDAGSDPDVPDSEGWTPLRAAAWAGHASTVQVLLERGAQVDASDSEGRTALRAAAWAGHEEVVRLLLNAGGQVDGQDRQGRTPLIAAAYMGHADIVTALLDAGAQPDHVDCEGRTALSVAVLSVACRSQSNTKIASAASQRRCPTRRRKSTERDVLEKASETGTLSGGTLDGCDKDNEAVETVTILLEYGAAVNHPDKEGMTPLLVAAFEGHRTVCELLLEADADVDQADLGGRTPLLAAASMGHGHIVELLLFWGCYVDSIDAEGRTVLSIAAAQGSVEVVRLLLDRGLDEAHRDNAGWSPLHYAAFEGHVTAVDLLYEIGARLDATDNDGRPPLLLAAQEGHVAVVERLIQLGAEVDQKSLDGKTALRVAALEGHCDVMVALIAAGADVAAKDPDGRSTLYLLSIENKIAPVEMILKAGKYNLEEDRDLEGRTPLHIAAWQGHTAMVELLLRHGADVNAVDREQRTPLQSCAWQGHESVVWLLLKAGANGDQPCSQGATPLSIAAQEGHEGVARLLLASGADPNRADGCGRTALKLAMKGGHKKVIQLLENWSATCSKSSDTNSKYLSVALGNNIKDHSPSSTFETASGKSGSNMTTSTTPRSSMIADTKTSPTPSLINPLSFTQQLQEQANQKRGSRTVAAALHLPLYAATSRVLSPLSEPQSPLYASPPPPTPPPPLSPQEQPPIWQLLPPQERLLTSSNDRLNLVRREVDAATPPVPHRTSSVDPDRLSHQRQFLPDGLKSEQSSCSAVGRPVSVPLAHSSHMQIILGIPSKSRRNGFGQGPVGHQRDHPERGSGLSGIMAGIRNSALLHGSNKLKNALCNAVSRPVGVIKKETQL